MDFEFGEGLDGELEFALGLQGVGQTPSPVLNPSFGSATIKIFSPHAGFCPQHGNGDVDRNGIVDFGDIVPIIALLRGSPFRKEADTDFDGVISFLDIPGFIAILRNQYTEVILVFVSFVFFVVDQKIHEPVPPQLRRM